MAFLVVTGLCWVLLVLSVQLAAARWRERQLQDLALRPNCLLTRYPLVFLTGGRSLFFFLNYWHLIPGFLREHGYSTELLSLPWRREQTRRQTLLTYLDDQATRCHLIGDSSIEEELVWLRSLDHPKVASVTLVEGDHEPSKKLSPEDLKPRPTNVERLLLAGTRAWKVRAHPLSILEGALLKLHNVCRFPQREIRPWEVGQPFSAEPWTVEKKFLDHAISLAERDSR